MFNQLIGKTLDRYKIVALLGEGGMGAVFKGRDVTLQRDVAVKVMHPQFARRPDFQERFLQEARTAAQLDHPSVVEVFDFGEVDDSLFIVMEFIPGDNLRAMLSDLHQEGNWILLEEAIELIRQVALALDYVHRQGVLHRDIKPSNIMLKPEASDRLPYRPVLTDLGLAKLIEGGLITAEGTSMGTPAYMSPEQASGQTTDARSDVYSLGILLFELSVGQRPFPIKTITEAIRYHTKEDPPRPSSLRADLPAEIEAVILKAMSKDPSARYADARAMADALLQEAEAATQLEPEPAAAGPSVSLKTQYEKSLVDVRGPSVFEGMPEAPSQLVGDRVSLRLPHGATDHINLTEAGLTIGRDEDNDLVLDFPNVSRHHARIERDGDRYFVVDLNSTNGTYLANTKVLPGVRERWDPEDPLKIGDSWLRLERGQALPEGTGFVSAEPQPGGAGDEAPAGDGRVAAFVTERDLSVAPGGSTTCKLTILNQSSVVDHFQVVVAGIPAEWLPSPPPTVKLMPGMQKEVAFSIAPPRSPESRAGDYTLSVRAISQEAAGVYGEAQASLKIKPYSQFSAELAPSKLRANSTGTVKIHNQGNQSETFTIELRDQSEELRFEPSQGQVTIPEGQTGSLRFRAAPKRRRWIGGASVQPFSVGVSDAADTAQRLAGQLASRGLIPVWAPPIVLLLCLGLAAGGALVFASRRAAAIAATETLQAAVTETLEAIALGANAQTETAIWLEGDDDRDGLSNSQELELGTFPDRRDSDEDGLDDGDELTRGTEPLIPDTDGDGLKDGAEVSQGLDPLDEDTDGDGTPDATDPDPGQVPTDTPSPSPTITDTPTPTPTPTDTPTPTSTPAIYSAGSEDIPQTWFFDLDEGVVSASNADTDFQFQAVTATSRYLSPTNGATFAIVGTESVGKSGCIDAPLSSAKIHVDNLDAGTYVCAKTSDGRYSEFRIKSNIGPSPGTMRVSYTTWEQFLFPGPIIIVTPLYPLPIITP